MRLKRWDDMPWTSELLDALEEDGRWLSVSREDVARIRKRVGASFVAIPVVAEEDRGTQMSFAIETDDGRTIGVLTLRQAGQPSAWQVDILVYQSHRKMGAAAFALKTLTERYPSFLLVGQVYVANPALDYVVRLLQRAGFKRDEAHEHEVREQRIYVRLPARL